MIKITPLKGKKNFIEAFKNSKKYNGENVIIYIEFKEKYQNANATNTILYGISVSKKISKKAVIRNRIKRLIREALRNILNAENNLKNTLIIEKIIVKWIGKAPKHPKLIKLEEVKNAIGEIFSKLSTKET